MMHPGCLLIRQPSGHQAIGLDYLIDIVLRASVLHVPVVIDNLPCVPGDGVRLLDVALNEQKIPSSISIDILECVSSAVGCQTEC